MRTKSRLLQTCSSLKMMAMVRTSLQKVVVFLHRLQRMAISSPRYQKLCKSDIFKNQSLLDYAPTTLGESVMSSLSCLPGVGLLSARLEQ
ncbi:hypothetical protein D4764_19G0006250 [Takifugu flavidus]|uniref:Uncharacterized protein n=1 Tax=Takifugu flavidus TaxID=433684 RepID=A0A5C6NTA4_9TELE|nr:hypothetical protein D4764_19G0006250 [Takifugu flavidus]